MTPPRPKRTRKPAQVSIRASVYDRIAERARGQGTQVSQLVDEIIARYLDEQERTS